MACDIDAEGLADIASQDDRIKTCRVDVTNEESVTKMVAETVQAFGSVNGLINNAGIFRDGLLVRRDRTTGAITKMSTEMWQEVIDVDLTGPFLCTREVVAKMVEHGWGPGVIINISSSSRHGNRGQSNYSAAKAGLVADTKLWAEELARYGIRTGAIAPGFVETPILEAMRPDMLEKLVKSVPLGRVGKPEEIYRAVEFIIECDYFTGKCIDVDGGIRT
jgi:3-oxoacyl-[acyl-carrier protein] reductase